MIKFGTSGFRGIIGSSFTEENIKRVGFSLAEKIRKDNKKNATVVVGYDNRFMSENFAKWISEAISNVASLKFFTISVPSPLIAFEAKTYDYGVMITASHNPYYYNGVKIFLHGGKECDDGFAKEIETFANAINSEDLHTTEFELAVKEKKIILSDDVSPYCDAILSLLDKKAIQKKNLKVLANAMHGNSTPCLEYIFKKLKMTKTETMNKNIDPFFEHRLPAPYVYNLVEQADRVKKEGYDLGVAFDGDSDRFSLVSESGKIYDCNFVVAVLYYYYAVKKKICSGLVTNVNFTTLAKKICEKASTIHYESKCGFKNIAPLLENNDTIIGAETNGIAFKKMSLSKDGVMACFAVIDALSSLGKGFDELLSEIQNEFSFKSEVYEFAYEISEQKKEEIKKLLFVDKCHPEMKGHTVKSVDERDGFKVVFENGYWGSYRFSGNEPVVRIFSEMKDKKECDKMFKVFEDFISVHDRQK